MRRIPRLLLIALLFLISLLLLWSFLDKCTLFELGLKSDSVCQFVYNYQSLLAGILAVVAALLTLLPVYGQLGLMRLQSAIMTRDVLVKRLNETEVRRSQTKSDLEKITTEFERDIYRGDPDEQPDIEPEWAFNAEMVVKDTIDKLRRYLDSRIDPKQVNVALSSAIVSAEDFANCLDSIHTPAREPWDDPELGLSDEDIKEIEAKANADAGIAIREFHGKLSDLRKVTTEIEVAYLSVVERLRTRVRDLDDFILSENF